MDVVGGRGRGVLVRGWMRGMKSEGEGGGGGVLMGEWGEGMWD